MRLEPRDQLILELLQRHGPLHNPYLFEFTKHLAHDRAGFRKRLLALRRNGYIFRPDALKRPHVDADFHVFKLADKGKEALGAKQYRYANPIPGWDEHAFMIACITANIELEAVKRGCRFISQEEILAQAPGTTQTAKSPLLIPSKIGKTLENGRHAKSDKGTEPDQLFGIEYPDGKARFFALEADRGNEPQTRNNLYQNSIEKKLLGYEDIFKNQMFKRHFGIPFAFPTFITTSIDRAFGMVQLVKSTLKKHDHLFLFRSIDGFHPYLRTPPLMPDLFGKYQNTDGTLDISKA